MIIVMVVGLYTVRAILDILGVVDYGIYNVVGGVVAMFSFVSGTLASASQRYFSIELAKGDYKRLNEWFCLNISTFSIFIFVFLVIAETLGLWFLNYKMVIPEERMFAANVVYQFSIISFCVSFFSIPYNALIIAHEKMSAFAYISIVEAALKLAIVFILKSVLGDKLIVYGILMLLTSTGITMSYIIYNIRHYSESKFHFYWNKGELKELISFSGWHMLATFSNVIRSYGINLLLNVFFNPAINAARAVAFQIYNAVNQLSGNFFTAVKPQIYKSYANGDYQGLFNLISRSTIICAFLVSVLIMPIISNTYYILGLWLKEVPDFTLTFTQLVLINGLVDSVSGPAIAPALATGNIKKFQICVSIVTFLNLPISYVCLKLGSSPTSTMIVSISLSYITIFVRAYLLRTLISISFIDYIKLIAKITLVSISICLIIKVLPLSKQDFWGFFINSLCIECLLVFLYVFFVFRKEDIKVLMKQVTKYAKSRKFNISNM